MKQRAIVVRELHFNFLDRSNARIIFKEANPCIVVPRFACLARRMYYAR